MNVLPCEQARKRMHVLLDGGLCDASVRQRLDDHLADCPACRDRFDELNELQRSLQALPTAPFPEAAFAEVLERTRTMQPGRPALSGRIGWRVAAAAAVLVLAIWGAWSLRPTPATPPDGVAVAATEEDAPEFTAEEREQAIREARMALTLAASALDRAQEASVRRVEEVLNEDVSPALEKVPVKLPGRPEEGHSRT